jgi:transglutaminase-like putative cysteine protease
MQLHYIGRKREKMDRIDEKYLLPTAIIDSDSPLILEHAEKIIGTAGGSAVEKAVKLYYAVRDGIWYDPYYPFYRAEHYRASNVLKSGRGFCVSKASLLCALGRACGVPSCEKSPCHQSADRFPGYRSICLSRVYRILPGWQMG